MGRWEHRKDLRKMGVTGRMMAKGSPQRKKIECVHEAAIVVLSILTGAAIVVLIYFTGGLIK